MKSDMEPINSATAISARDEISKALGSLARNVQTEIQDYGEFLLVKIEKNSAGSEGETAQIIKVAASILDRLIQPRSNEYAWMVNVERRDALLDSEVGGRK